MQIVGRPNHLAQVMGLLQRNPIVGLLGARQVGKSTLARMVCERWSGTPT